MDVVSLDLEEFEDSIRDGSRAGLQKAVEIYVGEFLEAFELGTFEFDQWLLPRRRWLAEQVVEALQTLTIHFIDDEDFRNALPNALRWVELAPLQEAGHLRLMEIYAKMKRRGDALRQFRECRRLLAEELGLNPSKQIRALYHSIVEGEVAANRSDRPRISDISTHNGAHELNAGTSTDPTIRQVTVLQLFFDPSFEEGANSAQSNTYHSSQHLDQAREILGHYTCSTIELVGNTMVAVFGVPQARSRDTELAVRASIAIRDRVSATCRIGIATGQVVYPQDDDDRGIVGQAVDRAARLQAQSSPGQIRVGAPVERALPQAVNRRQIGGDDTPLGGASWEIIDADGDISDDSPFFVGRDYPLAQLRAGLDICLETGRGHPFVIIGEAGLGKSRLVNEVSHLARKSSFSIHRTGALDLGVGHRGLEIERLVASLLGLSEDRGDEARRQTAVAQAVEQGLIDASQEIFVRDLLGLPRTDEVARLFREMGVQIRNENRNNTVRRLIDSTSRRTPLVLVIEDLHWMDMRSLECLASIAENIKESRAVLLMTSRPAENPFHNDEIPLPSSATELHLGPLGKQDTAAIASSFSNIEQAYRQRCIERSEGNPLFLIQLLNTPADDPDVPATIQSIVHATMDTLQVRHRRVLQAASVLGQGITESTLGQMLEGQHIDTQPLLDSRLMRREGSQLVFSHALTREAVYSSILDDDRRRWHEIAAELHSDEPGLQAEHLARSGAERAPEAFADAVLCAAQRYDYERALALAERGLELESTRATRFALQNLRAAQLLHLGRPERALAAHKESLKSASTEVARARAYTGMAEALRILERDDRTADVLEKAEEAARKARRSDLLAPIHYLRGSLYFMRGDVEGCINEHQEALCLARQDNLPRREVQALSGLGDAHYLRGHMRTAHRCFDQCTALARQRGFGRIEAANLLMKGLTQFYLCDSEEALRVASTALQRARVVGNRRATMIAVSTQCDILTFRAELTALRGEAQNCLELARSLGSRRFIAVSHGYEGWALAQQGRRKEGVSLIESGLELIEDGGIAFAGPHLMGLLATATDDPDRRRQALREGEKYLEQNVAGHNYLYFYPLACWACFELSDRKGIEKYAGKLRSYTEEEPLEWSEFFADWAELLCSVLDETPRLEMRQKIEKQAHRSGLSIAFLPLRNTSVH